MVDTVVDGVVECVVLCDVDFVLTNMKVVVGDVDLVVDTDVVGEVEADVVGVVVADVLDASIMITGGMLVVVVVDPVGPGVVVGVVSNRPCARTVLI